MPNEKRDKESSGLRRTRGRTLRFLAWLATLAFLAGCTQLGPRTPAWPELAEGRIWEPRLGRPVSGTEMAARMADSPLILLGEVHDNPAHRELQVGVLRELVALGRRPALALEMLEIEDQASITAVRGSLIGAIPSADAADRIAEAVEFDRKGWSWERYRPFIQLAVDHNLPIVAANLSRERARNVVRGGFPALGKSEMGRLGLPHSIDDSGIRSLRDAIIDGHCGQLPPAAVDGMLQAQQARDATIAGALRSTTGIDDPRRGAVLIAGAGHVRRDFGVPAYLMASGVPARPTVNALSIGFVEADPKARTEASVARSYDGIFDLVWFTSPHQRVDPCAGFKPPGAPRSEALSTRSPV